MPGPSVRLPLPGRSAAPSTAAPPTAGPAGDGPAGGSGWRLLPALLRPRRRPLAAAAAWSLVEAVPALLSGLLLAAALDGGFLAGRPGAGLAWLGLLGFAMLFRAVAMRMMFPCLAAVVEPLRDDLVRALVSATVTRAAGGAAPDPAAATRLTEQVETVRNLVSALLRSARTLGMSLVAALGGLLILSPVVAAAVAVPVAAALAVFARLMPVLLARQRALILADEDLTARATPILAGLRDIAACGARAQAHAAVESAVAVQAAATRALARAGVSRRLVVTLGAHLPLAGLLIAARPLIEAGHLSPGEVVGAAAYLATGLDPAMRMLVGVVGSWGVTLTVVLGRLAETVAVPARIPPGPPSPSPAALTPAALTPARNGAGRPLPSRPLPERPLSGHRLEVEGLSFAYASRAAPVVHGLDLTVAEGEHLAVVGPSGVGKSTLSMLLTGLQRPTGGRIRLGGLALEAIPEHLLRTVVALVPQEAYVFAGTLGENLAYLCPSDPRTADRRVREAVDAVGARALVERLGGLDAVIEEPAALSAGERQLITLARAYASPARVVVLDEATCHLDPAAELRAETAFAAREGTLIVIAHRISSACRAGRVLVMDGADALTGSHRELLARSPVYAGLVGHWRDDDAAGGPSPRQVTAGT
ncbi:ATP-binding cassette domain-containing protein [Planobispora takensis]|uniref:ABC transporter ATP-binding protein n=1 Tax=Planobispora takensis TaxID=1367882 RepID=A0A8J3T398_9ACTN|nr:ABC transporter ATP-binding protein [Planobispora takensis]GII04446.1 ABC transporter ATP-binding protein [Planobispora takensis]